MVEIREAATRKEQKAFVDFPLTLYKNNPYFVPPLYGEEMAVFKKDYVYYDTCEAVYFNAYKDGRHVGRISGILQKAANEKNHEKRIRFTRFDAIDDIEVSKALFGAVEDWGRKHGMDTICGPLGFSDLEREGLLIDGFDQLATFEEQYNADYYQKHLEALGYEKEVDWVESYVRLPAEKDRKLYEMSDLILKKFNLHWAESKNLSEFIRDYSDKFFGLLDTSYEKIYGTVPFTDNMKKMMIANFRLIVKLKYVGLILDEHDNAVAFGICFPSLAKAVQKSGGHLYPWAILRLLHAINHPTVIDLGLIGVDPAYLSRGAAICVATALMDMMRNDHIEHCETNLNLENNFPIRNLWKRFDTYEHKRRRSYIKKL